jgi:hypothetical protein
MQRRFERTVYFRDYKTVTGHVTAYYASPLLKIDLAVHLRQWFSPSRFFTGTNVSAKAFGEGSFDKGLFFWILFGGILPANTSSAFSTILWPLQRDGGRRLDNFLGGSVWFNRRFVRYDARGRSVDRMLPRDKFVEVLLSFSCWGDGDQVLTTKAGGTKP